MRTRFLAAIFAVSLVTPGVAAAQDVGVMQSAETINRGNFKILGNPMIVFGRDGGDDDIGVAGSLGYGFSDDVDGELRLAIYDGVTFIGGDVEFWFVKDESVNMSFIAGINRALRDSFDSTGLEFTLLGSGNVSPRLELYGALDLSRQFISDSDASYTTVHLVPGIEYSLGPDLDFVAEVGLGLNDDSRHYLSAGLAFYIR